MFTKHYKIIVFLISVLFVGISLKLANDDSLTFDEVAHIPAGYSYVTQFDYRLNPEHPPLIKTLTGISLLFLNLNFDTNLDFWNKQTNGEFGQWSAGHHLLFEAGNDVDKITFWARLPVVFIALFLALLLFYWGRKIGGVATGLLAFLFCVFDPNILGHNHLVTTDIGIATFTALTFFAFFLFLKNPNWKNVLFFGLTLGLTQVTKFSAILLVFFCCLLFGIFLFLKFFEIEKHHRLKVLANYCGKMFLSLVMAGLVIWLVYIPFTFTMPKEVLAQIAPAKIDKNKILKIDANKIFVDKQILIFVDEQILNFIEITNENSLTRPLGTYVFGVMYVRNRVAGGNGAYFMQEVSSNAFPLYFPVAFLTKQTLIHLFFYIFAITAFFVLIYKNFNKIRTKKFSENLISLRKYALKNFVEISLIGFIIFYFYISVKGNLNIGFRHLFPMMPFVYLITARVCVNVYGKLVVKKEIIAIRYVFLTLISLMICQTIWAFPYYISYFNETVGGSKNGYKIMTDSNADWGQDLKRMEKYLEKHPEIDKIRFHYFGGDRPKNRLGGKFIEWWDSKRPIESGYYAISVNQLQGSIYDKNRNEDDSYRWTLKYKPIDQIGTSILIFKVE